MIKRIIKTIIPLLLMPSLAFAETKFDWENNLNSEIKENRTHFTKDFPHPINPDQIIRIQSLELFHAYTDKGFEDIKRELPNYEFPEGKEIREEKPYHYIMDLPNWGIAKIEDGGRAVRIYDKKNVPIYYFFDLLFVEKGKAPFYIKNKEGIKIKEVFNRKAEIKIDEVIERNSYTKEAKFKVEDGKLFIEIPKGDYKYPLQVYDDTNTSSTLTGDTTFASNVPNNNYNNNIYGLLIRKYSGVNIWRSVVDFTLSSGSGTISTIKLFIKLYYAGCYLPGSFNYEVDVHELTQTFNEAQATWNNRLSGTPWTTAGGDFSSTIVDALTINAPTQNTWYSWVLLGSGSDNPISGLTWGSQVDLIIKVLNDGSGGNGSYLLFYDKDYYGGSNTPYIEITYTPSDALLLGGD